MRLILLAALTACFLIPASAQTFDFTRPADCREWRATHDVSSLEATAEGLAITISGDDPYITGPARDYPSGRLLWMTVRLKSEQDGMAQIFYFDRGTTEERSVRFPVRAGDWQEVRLPMPALGPRYRLRFDPPGTTGKAVVSRISFIPRVPFEEPQWAGAVADIASTAIATVRSGELTLLHGKGFGQFAIRLGDKELARGFKGARIGYVANEQQKWIDLDKARAGLKEVRAEIVLSATIKDDDGGTWRIEQRFAPARRPREIDVRTTVTVDREREVAFVPLLVLFPGAKSFGPGKTQALFPGLEYLDRDEPSSSEADIIGPGSQRRVPDTARITMPLMTVVAEGRYVGLAWKPAANFAALFDSPDRKFQSGGHAMGLLFPGSSGSDRAEGSLLPHGPVSLAANQPIVSEATILAGDGSSAVEAVKHMVGMNGLPAAPRCPVDLSGYAKLAAAGWLDSQIREGARFRHATPGQFAPQPAADAAWMMDWLANVTADAALSNRLSAAAVEALGVVSVGAYDAAAVSHVRYPVASLLYGHVDQAIERARASARSIAAGFEPDGTMLYHPGKTDYGKTHFARDANGLTAQAVASLLEHAAVCGDPEIIATGVRLLHGMDKFTGSVPRGAQTWECPLHTPDILASAHLVKAYVIGYELTGDERLLDTARYWAWTGVPFVYLVDPLLRGAPSSGSASRPATRSSSPPVSEVGLFATIAVYGATGWVAPNWMGLPVQWCGLVYADALYRLSKYDGAGPWKQLADGIVVSGIQQTFPAGSGPRNGLLPDSFVLRAGVRQNPAINPGTVQGPATHYFNRPAYDFAAGRKTGLLVHAPGEIANWRETADAMSFSIRGSLRKEARVPLSGCRHRPAVTVDGRGVELEWLEQRRCAVVPVVWTLNGAHGDVIANVQVRVGFE